MELEDASEFALFEGDLEGEFDVPHTLEAVKAATARGATEMNLRVLRKALAAANFMGASDRAMDGLVALFKRRTCALDVFRNAGWKKGDRFWAKGPNGLSEDLLGRCLRGYDLPDVLSCVDREDPLVGSLCEFGSFHIGWNENIPFGKWKLRTGYATASEHMELGPWTVGASFVGDFGDLSGLELPNLARITVLEGTDGTKLPVVSAPVLCMKDTYGMMGGYTLWTDHERWLRSPRIELDNSGDLDLQKVPKALRARVVSIRCDSFGVYWPSVYPAMQGAFPNVEIVETRDPFVDMSRRLFGDKVRRVAYLATKEKKDGVRRLVDLRVFGDLEEAVVAAGGKSSPRAIKLGRVEKLNVEWRGGVGVRLECAWVGRGEVAIRVDGKREVVGVEDADELVVERRIMATVTVGGKPVG